MFFIGLVLGAMLGIYSARKRNGNLADILQYAAGYGIACGLAFMIFGLIWLRMGF